LSKKILIFSAALLLSACGYHLRGAVELPEGLKHVYLEGASMPLREQFRKALRAASGELVDTPENASVTIRIVSENASQRALSLSARGRSNELELNYRLAYNLVKPDDTLLIEQQPVEVRREYFNNQQDIVAKDNEQQVIRNEMYQQAVRMIVDRTRIVLAAHAQ
jgi:LPS-assembly lipoprotein